MNYWRFINTHSITTFFLQLIPAMCNAYVILKNSKVTMLQLLEIMKHWIHTIRFLMIYNYTHAHVHGHAHCTYEKIFSRFFDSWQSHLKLIWSKDVVYRAQGMTTSLFMAWHVTNIDKTTSIFMARHVTNIDKTTTIFMARRGKFQQVPSHPVVVKFTNYPLTP